jgi:hypothetical protein
MKFWWTHSIYVAKGGDIYKISNPEVALQHARNT